MSGHTPGPWSLVDYGNDDRAVLVIHHDSESRICFMAMPGSHGDGAMIAADGRLISAAPDLLAAVRELMEQPTMNPLDMTPDQRAKLWSAHARARAAINKAEGR